MGNRAVITFAAQPEIGIYVHWNGGPESVWGFALAAEQVCRGTPEGEADYSFARLVECIGTYFGGNLSLGVGLTKRLDTDNGDNGTYRIGSAWTEIEQSKGSKGAKWHKVEAPTGEDLVKTHAIRDMILAKREAAAAVEVSEHPPLH